MGLGLPGIPCITGHQCDFFRNVKSILDMQMRAPWTPRPENESEKIREVSFTLSLTAPMGPKHSQVIETQVRSDVK